MLINYYLNPRFSSLKQLYLMLRKHKEKALLSLKYKIENLEKEAGFFRRNIIKVIFFGIGVSFWAPFYSGQSDITVMRRLGLSYSNSVIMVCSFYTFFCVLGHVVWTFQEKSKMKSLLKRKNELEKDLKKL